MKTYLVTFKNKKGEILNEVKIFEKEDRIINPTAYLCFAALDQIRNEGITMPLFKKTTWSFKEI